MRSFLFALSIVVAAAWVDPAMADHIGANEHTHCASKKYRAKHKRACAHWGAHHHHGIHLEGSR
jgi:hypothetical protein